MNATYVACLTPPGTAALATLAVCGPEAWHVARQLFEPAGPTPLPVDPSVNQFWFGRLGNALGKDEVVLALKQIAPMPLVEIHCHGGTQVVALLQDTFLEHGVQLCSWQELYRHVGMPHWRIAAEEALAQATTTRTAAILLDQYHGALHRAVAELVDSIQTDQAQRLLGELLERIPLGRHLVEPWKIVIAGPPNVGKSSLVNALAGFTRSVVSHEPGTTRDVVTSRVALDGWPVELADTAGWRDATEPLEQAGIERARHALDAADVVLWLLDGSSAPVFPEFAHPKFVLAINKIDLPAAWGFQQVAGVVRVSARTGEGVTALCHSLANLLVPHPPAPGAAVPFTASLCDLLEKAHSLFVAKESQEVLRLLQSIMFDATCLSVPRPPQ